MTTRQLKTQRTDWTVSQAKAKLSEVIEKAQNRRAPADNSARQRSEIRGQRMELMDCFLAATATVHRLTLLTRNIEDFTAFRGDLFNPWN